MPSYKRLGGTILLLIAGLCFVAFAVVTAAFAEDRQRLSGYLDKVDASDGIDFSESQSIARIYFDVFISGCGGPDQGNLVGSEWVIPVSEGFAGKPLASPLKVNANSGAISHASGPSFSSYRTFRFVVLWGLPIYRLGDFAQRNVDETIAGDH